MYRKANIVFYVKRFPHFTCNRSSWTLSSSPMLPLMKPNICFSPLCLQDRINWVFVVYHKIIGCNIWRIENIIRNIIYICAQIHVVCPPSVCIPFSEARNQPLECWANVDPSNFIKEGDIAPFVPFYISFNLFALR